MVKKLGFEEEPAYKEYIQMFNNLFTSKDFELDYAYDWVTVKNNTNVLKDASLIRSQEYSKQEDRVVAVRCCLTGADLTMLYRNRKTVRDQRMDE